MKENSHGAENFPENEMFWCRNGAFQYIFIANYWNFFVFMRFSLWKSASSKLFMQFQQKVQLQCHIFPRQFTEVIEEFNKNASNDVTKSEQKELVGNSEMKSLMEWTQSINFGRKNVRMLRKINHNCTSWFLVDEFYDAKIKGWLFSLKLVGEIYCQMNLDISNTAGNSLAKNNLKSIKNFLSSFNYQ